MTNRKPRRRVTGEQRRINLKVDDELAAWIFDYVARNKTSVTGLVTDFFLDLRRKELERLARDAEQI